MLLVVEGGVAQSFTPPSSIQATERLELKSRHENVPPQQQPDMRFFERVVKKLQDVD